MPDVPQPKGYLNLHDLAVLHETTEAEVWRVWVAVLRRPPKTRFDWDDLRLVNRILAPVPEPWEIIQGLPD